MSKTPDDIAAVSVENKESELGTRLRELNRVSLECKQAKIVERNGLGLHAVDLAKHTDRARISATNARVNSEIQEMIGQDVEARIAAERAIGHTRVALQHERDLSATANEPADDCYWVRVTATTTILRGEVVANDAILCIGASPDACPAGSSETEWLAADAMAMLVSLDEYSCVVGGMDPKNDTVGVRVASTLASAQLVRSSRLPPLLDLAPFSTYLGTDDTETARIIGTLLYHSMRPSHFFSRLATRRIVPLLSGHMSVACHGDGDTALVSEAEASVYDAAETQAGGCALPNVRVPIQRICQTALDRDIEEQRIDNVLSQCTTAQRQSYDQVPNNDATASNGSELALTEPATVMEDKEDPSQHNPTGTAALVSVYWQKACKTFPSRTRYATAGANAKVSVCEGRATVWATRDIPKGEEIVVLHSSVLDVFPAPFRHGDLTARQEHLALRPPAKPTPRTSDEPPVDIKTNEACLCVVCRSDCFSRGLSCGLQLRSPEVATSPAVEKAIETYLTRLVKTQRVIEDLATSRKWSALLTEIPRAFSDVASAAQAIGTTALAWNHERTAFNTVLSVAALLEMSDKSDAATAVGEQARLQRTRCLVTSVTSLLDGVATETFSSGERLLFAIEVGIDNASLTCGWNVESLSGGQKDVQTKALVSVRALIEHRNRLVAVRAALSMYQAVTYLLHFAATAVVHCIAAAESAATEAFAVASTAPAGAGGTSDLEAHVRASAAREASFPLAARLAAFDFLLSGITIDSDTKTVSVHSLSVIRVGLTLLAHSFTRSESHESQESYIPRVARLAGVERLREDKGVYEAQQDVATAVQRDALHVSRVFAHIMLDFTTMYMRLPVSLWSSDEDSLTQMIGGLVERILVMILRRQEHEPVPLLQTGSTDGETRASSTPSPTTRGSTPSETHPDVVSAADTLRALTHTASTTRSDHLSNVARALRLQRTKRETACTETTHAVASDQEDSFASASSSSSSGNTADHQDLSPGGVSQAVPRGGAIPTAPVPASVEHTAPHHSVLFPPSSSSSAQGSDLDLMPWSLGSSISKNTIASSGAHQHQCWQYQREQWAQRTCLPTHVTRPRVWNVPLHATALTPTEKKAHKSLRGGTLTTVWATFGSKGLLPGKTVAASVWICDDGFSVPGAHAAEKESLPLPPVLLLDWRVGVIPADVVVGLRERLSSIVLEYGIRVTQWGSAWLFGSESEHATAQQNTKSLEKWITVAPVQWPITRTLPGSIPLLDGTLFATPAIAQLASDWLDKSIGTTRASGSAPAATVAHTLENRIDELFPASKASHLCPGGKMLSLALMVATCCRYNITATKVPLCGGVHVDASEPAPTVPAPASTGGGGSGSGSGSGGGGLQDVRDVGNGLFATQDVYAYDDAYAYAYTFICASAPSGGLPNDSHTTQTVACFEEACVAVDLSRTPVNVCEMLMPCVLTPETVAVLRKNKGDVNMRFPGCPNRLTGEEFLAKLTQSMLLSVELLPAQATLQLLQHERTTWGDVEETIAVVVVCGRDLWWQINPRCVGRVQREMSQRHDAACAAEEEEEEEEATSTTPVHRELPHKSPEVGAEAVLTSETAAHTTEREEGAARIGELLQAMSLAGDDL